METGGCVCGRTTVPFKVEGKGSVRVTLIPAPGGVGLAIGNVGKTILGLAGIDDVWSATTMGQTQTTISFACAIFEALKELSKVNRKQHPETLKI